MKQPCEPTTEDIRSKLVGLMRGPEDPNPFLERYAECLDKASTMDDLSFVRMGRDAEAFESDFRHFVNEFPGSPVVTVPEGEFSRMGVFLARTDPELRRAVLRQLADGVRAKMAKNLS